MEHIIIGISAYVICALILWLLNREYVGFRREETRFIPTIFREWPILLSILLFGIFYGIRYDTGADNLMYIDTFEKIKSGVRYRENIEYGFLLISQFLASLELHFSAYIAFWGCLIYYFLYKTLKPYYYVLPYFALFLVLGPMFLEMANIMRQMVAFSIFIYAIKFIEKRNILKYCLCIAICVLFHKSAIILLPFFFLLMNPLVPKKCWVAVLIFVCFTIIGNSPQWSSYLLNIEQLLIFWDYGNYVDHLASFTESDWSIGWGPGRIFSWMLMLLTIVIFYNLNKNHKISKILKKYFCCFFWGACLYNLLINTNQVFLRPISYFYDCYIIVIPICLYYLSKIKTHSYSKNIAYWGYSFLAYFYSVYFVIHGTLTNTSYEVYKLFFLE